jgi:PHD/YefM family antitoxin component YafN of YafNO toxin-antitoxin module
MRVVEPVVALLHEPGSDPLLLSENGRAAAVLMSAEEYGRLRARSLEEFQQLCEKAGAEAQANGLTGEILQEILAEAKAERTR